MHEALCGGGLRLRITPIIVRLHSSIPDFADGLLRLYGDHEILEPSGFADFHISLASPGGLRRWLRPQVNFIFDGFRPFKPLPREQAYPMFEWGLNWCVAQHFHHVISIHSAAIARGGSAVILPAPPGSGKSTLCAGLVARGWRLLSDELALIRPEDLQLVPCPRPISLKNQSIDVIGDFAMDCVIGLCYRDTHKGDVAHMKPPAESVERAAEFADPRWIIFPRYASGMDAVFSPVRKAEAVVRLAENGFNYAKLGPFAFHVLNRLVDQCQVFDFVYSRLEEAVDLFDSLFQT